MSARNADQTAAAYGTHFKRTPPDTSRIFGDDRAPGVEANARLTAATGLLLAVMLVAEGFTILAIHPLLSWHVAIGLALIPPVGLKLASTSWRFARYYLGDRRYRQAGPPVAVLRMLGPVLVVTTIALLASGVAAWIAGPGSRTLIGVHEASFVLWFAAMTIHFLAHAWRSVRLTRADISDRALRLHASAPYRRARYGLVFASLAAGIVVAVATRGLAGGWTHWAGHVH